MIDMAASLTCLDDAVAVHQAFEEAARRMAARGTNVRILASTFVPVEERWVCLFAAADETIARRAADLAQIPERHIRSGVDLETFPSTSSAIA